MGKTVGLFCQVCVLLSREKLLSSNLIHSLPPSSLSRSVTIWRRCCNSFSTRKGKNIALNACMDLKVTDWRCAVILRESNIYHWTGNAINQVHRPERARFFLFQTSLSPRIYILRNYLGPVSLSEVTHTQLQSVAA